MAVAERGDDGRSSCGLADHEVAVARRRVSDQEKRQFGALFLVEGGHGYLLLSSDVKP